MAKDIKLDENIIKKNKISVLTRDKEWIRLFQQGSTKNMNKLAEKLEDLLSFQKECVKELKSSKKHKKLLMDKILKLSDAANTKNDKDALEKLEEAKNNILEINDKIDDIQFKLETLPKEIENTNFELLKETVIIAYKDIKEDRTRVKYLDDEIQRLRKILGEMWEEKFTKQKRIDNLYLYLHDTLGHKETDKMDKKFL